MKHGGDEAGGDGEERRDARMERETPVVPGDRLCHGGVAHRDVRERVVLEDDAGGEQDPEQAEEQGGQHEIAEPR